MELKSFREILLKKADGNPYLQTLIKYAKDELLADEVIESLLKMAAPSASMGGKANHAVTTYAAGMKPIHVEQLRDALGHHVSHYRGALKAHHEATDPAEKAKFRNIADQHLNKIVPMMHLAGKASKHSGGQLVLDAPPLEPWETNYTSTERRPETGKLKEGTKGLGRRPAPNASRARNPRAVPDYRYLEMPPHPGHSDTERSPHKGGYPFEEIQVGTPAKRDVGQAYLPIENVKVKDYVAHPFDAHPVHRFHDYAQHELGPEHHDAINTGTAGWQESEHNKQWLQDQKSKYAANPEAYKARGHKKPAHTYEGIPLAEMEHHKAAPVSAPVAAAPEVTQAAAPAKASGVIRKPAAKVEPAVPLDKLSEEDKKLIASLSPETRKKLGF